MRLQIKGFVPSTMVDWEGKLASSLFLPGCNFRCPFCHNPELVLHPSSIPDVSFEGIMDFLVERKGWIDGVCITGGEPCIHGDIEHLCREIRQLGLGVKLDTNGSIPGQLESLLDGGLLDFVSMDVKAPLEEHSYRVAAGVNTVGLPALVGESIALLEDSGLDHEFRTTVVPMLHGPAEIEKIACSLGEGSRYVLQYFRPGSTLNPRYSRLRGFSEEDMGRMLEKAREHLPGTALRGSPERAGDPR